MTKAPLRGLKDKNRIMNDYFVLFDKTKIKDKESRSEAVAKFSEHLKRRITKNTDYHDVKKVYNFGNLVVIRIRLPDQLVSVLQEYTDIKVVEANTR